MTTAIRPAPEQELFYYPKELSFWKLFAIYLKRFATGPIPNCVYELDVQNKKLVKVISVDGISAQVTDLDGNNPQWVHIAHLGSFKGVAKTNLPETHTAQ
jgi:hypothetical protein